MIGIDFEVYRRKPRRPIHWEAFRGEDPKLLASGDAWTRLGAYLGMARASLRLRGWKP